MKHELLITALALPLLGLVGLTGYKTVRLWSGAPVAVPITGYDPRDLLSGHYLTYRLQLPWDVCGGEPDDAVLLCLRQEHRGELDASRLASLDDYDADCTAVLRGTCSEGRFVAGVERFYVPEADAARLDALVRGWGTDAVRAAVRLKIDRHGSAALEELLLDGVPWRDYLAAHPQPP